MADDVRVCDLPAASKPVQQADERLDLRLREGQVAVLVAGVDQFHTDGARIHVPIALPVGVARVPGPPLLRHEPQDAALALDHVVGGDLGLRIAEPLQRRRSALHAGVVDHHHVGRRRAGVEVGGGDLDEFGFEAQHPSPGARPGAG